MVKIEQGEKRREPAEPLERGGIRAVKDNLAGRRGNRVRDSLEGFEDPRLGDVGRVRDARAVKDEVVRFR